MMMRFQGRLRPGENTLWVGTPGRWPYVRARMNSYFWQGATILVSLALTKFSMGLFGAFLATAVLLMGLAVWEARSLAYLVTNERILILYPQFRPWLARGNPGREIETEIPPDRIDCMNVQLSKAGDFGNICVNTRPWIEMTGLFGKRVGLEAERTPVVRHVTRGWSPPGFPAPSFFNGLLGIRDPERVADCIEQMHGARMR